MKCGNPIQVKGHWVPCGQCMPCRINTKRTWAGRILLEESGTYLPSSVITLTYSDENLPEHGYLSRDDLALFINRLRKKYRQVYDTNLRFFAVGEYGDKSGRPHFHVICFGLQPEHKDWIEKAWGMGHIKVDSMSRASAQYVAHYTTKKLTNSKDEYVAAALDGAPAEFARMSKRPPIGEPGARVILDIYSTRTGRLGLSNSGISRTFRYEGQEWPIGRYWYKWLHRQLGIEMPEFRDMSDYVDLPLASIGKTENAKKAINRAKVITKSQNGRRTF